MAFRSQAGIDPNQHKGLIALNSVSPSALVLTGLSLTNAQPLHVAIVDGSGTQVTSFGGGTITNYALETGGNLAAIKTDVDKIPSQGQALAAASTPVVLPATQITTLTPQTNALTDTQLRATPVPVSGTFWQSIQPVSGTVAATESGTWTVGTNSAVPKTGQTTSNSSAVQLTATSITMTNGILVQALSVNTANVYIGASTVTTSGSTGGYELQPGQTVPFTASNINVMYVIGSNNTDGVCWNVL